MFLSYPVLAPDNDAGLMAMRGDFDRNIALLFEMGYRCVELLVCDAGLLLAENFPARLRKSGMAVSAVSTAPIHRQDGLSLLHGNPRAREQAYDRALAALALAGELGCPLLIGKFRGNVEPGGTLSLDSLGRALLGLCEAAGGKQTPIALEPQNADNINNLNTVSECLGFIRQLSHPLLCLHLDSFHMGISENNILDAIRLSASRTGYVHLSDTGRKLPGEGRMDFHALLGALRQAGYDGALSPEVRQEPDSATVAARYLDVMEGQFGVRAQRIARL